MKKYTVVIEYHENLKDQLKCVKTFLFSSDHPQQIANVITDCLLTRDVLRISVEDIERGPGRF